MGIVDNFFNSLGYQRKIIIPPITGPNKSLVPKPSGVFDKSAGDKESYAMNPLAYAFNQMNQQFGLRKPSMVTYLTLRRMSRTNWVDRTCINTLRDEVTAIPWDINPIDPKQPFSMDFKNYLVNLLLRPSKKNNEHWRTLIDKVVEDILVIDAGCLWGKSSVLLSDGTKIHIGKIVNEKMEVEVMSFNEKTKQFEPKKVIGWHKNKLNDRKWVKVNYSYARDMGRFGRKSTWFTNDHPLLTENGWKEIKDITSNDNVFTNTLAPNILQKEIIDGAMLGDGGFDHRKGSNRSSFSITHSIDQSEWLNIKTNALNCFDFTYNEKIVKTGNLLRARSNYIPWLEKEYTRWHSQGKKIVPEDIILSDRLVATWYMDDGHLGVVKNDKGWKTSYPAYLNTCGFTKEEQEALANKLTLWGVESHIQVCGKYYRIYITTGGANIFFDRIAKYIVPALRYKLPPNSQEYNAESWNVGEAIPFTDTIQIEEGNPEGGKNLIPQTTYCLDVEDNHNFISSDLVAHNCIEKVRDQKGRIVELYHVDGACYSDDTEVLTKDGWKLFRDVDIKKDLFATRNQKTKEFEWQKSTYFHNKQWDGDFYSFKSRTLDLLVSPNHRMLYTSDPTGKATEMIKKAEDISQMTNGFLIANSDWKGKEIKSFTFKAEGKQFPITISGDDYMAFMGMYLAEGCYSNTKTTYISQKKESKGYKEFKELFVRMFGKEPCYTGFSWVISKKPFYNHVKQFGRATKKWIPEEIINATPKQLAIFWHFYLLGDGWIDGERQAIRTSSEKMADQLQEIAQKIGYSASISITLPKEKKIGDRVILKENQSLSYTIRLRTSKYQKFISKKVQYKGEIYCVSVPNEILYVRRNGQPVWCGNTIKPMYDEHGIIGDPIAYKQFLPGQKQSTAVAEWKNEDLIYMIWNPQGAVDTFGYGMSPVESGLAVGTAFLYAEAYNLGFFQKNTIPPMIINMGEDVPSGEVDKFRSFLTAEMMGINGFFTPVVMSGNKGFDVKNLLTAPKDMAWQEYVTWQMRWKVALYRMSPQDIGFTLDQYKVEGDVQQQLSKNKAINSLKDVIKQYINAEIVKDEGWGIDPDKINLEFKWIDDEVVDPQAQANVDNIYLNNGVISRNDVRIRQGLDPIRGGARPTITLGSELIQVDSTPVEEDELGQPIYSNDDEDEINNPALKPLLGTTTQNKQTTEDGTEIDPTQPQNGTEDGTDKVGDKDEDKDSTKQQIALGLKQEMAEHPNLDIKTVRQLVMDHLKKDPNSYKAKAEEKKPDEQFGKTFDGQEGLIEPLTENETAIAWMDDRGVTQPFFVTDYGKNKGFTVKPCILDDIKKQIPPEQRVAELLRRLNINTPEVRILPYEEVIKLLPTTLYNDFTKYISLESPYDSKSWRDRWGASRKSDNYIVTGYVSGLDLKGKGLHKTLASSPESFANAIKDLAKIWIAEKKFILGDRKPGHYIITKNANGFGVDYTFVGNEESWKKSAHFLPDVLEAINPRLKEMFVQSIKDEADNFLKTNEVDKKHRVIKAKKMQEKTLRAIEEKLYGLYMKIVSKKTTNTLVEGVSMKKELANIINNELSNKEVAHIDGTQIKHPIVGTPAYMSFGELIPPKIKEILIAIFSVMADNIMGSQEIFVGFNRMSENLDLKVAISLVSDEQLKHPKKAYAIFVKPNRTSGVAYISYNYELKV